MKNKIKRDDRVQEEVIEEITQQILERLSRKELDVKSTELNLSDKKFQLVNLNGLTQSHVLQMEKLQVINISNNKLKKIDTVQNFRTLRRIDASKNLIIGLSIDLPKLIELDLSFNKLQSVPDLSQLPRLEMIFLQYNQINMVDKELLASKQTLDQVNLSNNKIKFSKGKFLQQFIDNLKMMTVLTKINIDKNPFCEDFLRYKDFFIRHLCPQVEQINNVIIDDKQQKSIRAEQNFPDLNQIVVANNNKQGEKQVRNDIISLQQAVEYLEKCRNQPQNSIDIIQDLATELNKIVSSSGNWEDVFTSKNEARQGQLDDLMDDFFQNIGMLIENQTHIAKTVMSTLGTMSVITPRDIGHRCILLLKEFMMGNSEQKEKVFEVIRENLIPNISHMEIIDIPTQVLKGLISIIDTVKDPQIYTLFNESIVNFMSQWTKIILGFMKLEDRNPDTMQVYEHILQLVAVTSKNPRNASAMKGSNIFKDMQSMFQAVVNISMDKGYLSILETLKNIFRVEKSAAIEMIQLKTNMDSFYQCLLDEFEKINTKFLEFKHDLRDVKAKDSDQLVMAKFNKFGLIIETFGSLYRHWQIQAADFESDHVIQQVLAHSTIFRQNPQMIISVSLFIDDLLNNELITNSENMIRALVDMTHRINALVPYLGGKKYPLLCEMAEIYQANTFFNGEPVKIEINNNHIVHTVFKVILDVFYCFIHNSNPDETDEFIDGKPHLTVFQQICNDVLVSQLDKEQLLFKCLDVNNEDVKMSAIQCLLDINPDDWQAEYLEKLFYIAESYQNFGYGNTETILSCIFMIFIRVVKNQHSPVTIEFLSRSSGRINSACLDILQNNMSRNLSMFQDKHQQNQKIELSLSCVFFLKAVSEIPQARNNFSANQCRQALQNCLKDEERFMEESFITIDIERTHLGKNLEYLIGFTGGENAVDPYHLVSFRILSQIADLLEGKKEEIVDITRKAEKYDPNFMKEVVSNQIQARVKLEFEIWEEPDCEDVSQKEHFKANPSEWEVFVHQHTLFSKYEGIEKLLFYLLGKTANSNAQLLNNRLTKEFNPKFKNLEMKDTMTLTINKLEREEQKRQIYMQQKLNSGQINAPPRQKAKLDQEQSKDLVQMAFQEQNIHADIDPKILDKLLLQAPTNIEGKKQSMKDSKKKEAGSKKDGKEKKEKLIMLGKLSYEEQHEEIIRKRCLIVSTMLRAMNNSIQYAPGAATKKHAVDQLKRRATIKMLTQLCGTTGWSIANIGIKYLKIVFYGIQLSNKVNEEDRDNTEIYEIVSYAMIEMMTLIRIKVIQQDKTKLSIEDKTLIHYLAFGCNLIIQQVPSIIWSQLEARAFTHSQKTLLLNPTDKLTGQLISKLFPKEDIKVFLDELQYEMKLVKVVCSKDFKEDKGLRNLFKFNLKTRLSLIKFFGSYLARCREQCFEIMQFFVLGEVIDKKETRQSFLQEILTEMTRTLFKKTYQKHLLKKQLGHKANVLERVIEVFNILVCDQGSTDYQVRQMVMTDRLIYIFCLPYTKCTCCPDEFFCPDSPQLEFKIEYTSINAISLFEGSQRMAFRSSQMKKLNTGFSDMIFAKDHNEIFKILFFPKMDHLKMCMDVIRTYDEVYIQNDEMAMGGLAYTLKDYDLACWVMVNPGARVILNIEQGERNLEYSNVKSLMVIKEKTVRFYKDNILEWRFFDQRQIKELEELENKKSEMQNQALNADQIKEQERQNDRGIELRDTIKLIGEDKSHFFHPTSSEYEFSQLKVFKFEIGLVPHVTIGFGTFSSINIVFFCDTARQMFREELNYGINFDEYKTEYTAKANSKNA